MVVANDIKCEAQQELRVVKRKLQEEEEKSAKLQKELEELQGSSRSVAHEGRVLVSMAANVHADGALALTLH